MKINFNKNIPFEKKLRASCSVLKNGSNIPCKIYQLEPENEEDRTYFEKEKNKNLWQDSVFWGEIKDIFDTVYLNEDIFVLEDNEGNCLNITNTANLGKTTELVMIETAPSVKKAGYKYIGETMLSFVLGLIKKGSSNIFSVPIYRAEAKEFYVDKCGLKDEKSPYGLYMDKSDFDKLIIQNQNHTQNTINYLT